MKKIFISIPLLLTTLPTRAGENDCKENTTQLAAPRPKQKGLTPIPKTMKIIAQLDNEMRELALAQESPSGKSELDLPIPKKELALMAAMAKTSFPQWAKDPSTAQYMKNIEEIVSQLNSIVTVKGSILEALQLVTKMNRLADDLPKFISACSEKTGEIPPFLQLLASSGFPNNEQGRAAKSEIAHDLSKDQSFSLDI